MTAIVRRRPRGDRRLSRWPFDALMDWSPFYFSGAPFRPVGASLGIDAYYRDDDFVVSASVPGVPVDQIDVTLDNGILEIRASRDEESSEERDSYVIRERARGELSRALRLPDGLDIDKAVAKIDAGVLTVTVPRGQASKTKRIAIESTESPTPAASLEADDEPDSASTAE